MISITTITQLAIPFNPTPSANDYLYFYSYGYDNLNTSLNFVSAGLETIFDGLNLVATGSVIENSGLNLYAYGQYSYINNNLPLIAEGYTTTPNASLDFYAYVSDIGSYEGGVNLFAKVAEGASLDMIAFGPAYSDYSSIFFSAEGVNSINGSLDFITGNSLDTKSNSLTFYSIGW